MIKKFAFAAGAVALGLASPVSADTYSPASTSTFAGSVKVKKDGATYTCTLTVNVDATAGSTATATASLSGAFPCSLISVSGTGTVVYDGTYLTISGLVIDPPLSAGLCNGPIKTVWGGNSATPRKITLSSPLSDSSATSGAPCTMVGTLNQTAGAPVSVTP